MGKLTHLAGALFLAITAQSLQAQDVFDASPEVRVVRPHATASPTPRRNPDRPAANDQKAARISLAQGEVREVLRVSKFANPEWSFYLPPEATRVVQLVVERHALHVYYFLRARQRGNTVGGVVERSWLDREGFSPRSVSDEARIQWVIKGNPIFIEVK